MEKLELQINRIYPKDDGKMYIVFDILLTNNKIGEAEQEHSVFQSALIAKFQEFITAKHYTNLQETLSTIKST